MESLDRVERPSDLVAFRTLHEIDQMACELTGVEVVRPLENQSALTSVCRAPLCSGERHR